MITRFSYICIALLFLSNCTQTQLGAHVGKKIIQQSQSTGTFKVGNPYRIMGQKYYPKEDYYHEETGMASWYGPKFHGKQTANGEIFNKHELTAAHRTLQMPSLIEVTNLRNGKSVVLRVNDRGPFAKNRVLDVSERAAELLGFKQQGVTKVRLRTLPYESKQLANLAKQGKSTRGMENQFNKDGKKVIRNITLPAPTQVAQQKSLPVSQTQGVQLASVKRELVMPPQQIPGHVDSRGNFMPDPVVKNTHNPTGDIFVQAGSFGNPLNAANLSRRLESIASVQVASVHIDGQQFHRVKLGPFGDMAQAQSVLNKVASAGQSNAMILVE